MAKHVKHIPELSEKDKCRFFAKASNIPTETGCLEWKAYKNKKGYGTFGIGRKMLRSHRVAYFLATGEDPGELQIRHSCNNPSCCNPDHLSTGTSQDDANDRIRAGRVPRGDTHHSRVRPGRMPRGERQWKAKLTEAQVIAIRSDTRKLREIAPDYGVSIALIGLIKARKQWAHVK